MSLRLLSEDSRSHSDTSRSVGFLWTNGRPVAETYIWQQTTFARDTSIPPAGFEPAFPARQRPQTHAVDSAATGIVSIGFFYRYHGFGTCRLRFQGTCLSIPKMDAADCSETWCLYSNQRSVILKDPWQPPWGSHISRCCVWCLRFVSGACVLWIISSQLL